jgi:hypothetical protein
MEDLTKLDGSLKVIFGIARKLIVYAKKLANLKSSLYFWKRKRNFAKVYKIQGEIADLSKLYLGTEFAVKQNVRTAIDCIAGVVEGWRALNFDRQVTSVREYCAFESSDIYDLCPGWDGERDAQKLETVRVWWTITTDSQLSLRGSKLEQALAKVMAKAGVLPQLASIWEATPYSWLIDYVFRTGSLLRYVERANGIGVSDLDIFRTSLSVHIERVTEQVAGRHYPACGVTTRTWEFYERCVSPDLNFPPLMEWFKLPHGDQWAKAFAFFFSQFR